MHLEQAPAVHARRKSRWNPSALGRSIERAAIASIPTPRWLAVFHEGEVVGVMRGDGVVARFVPMTHRQWCGLNGYEDMITKARNGKIVTIDFYKDLSGGTVNSSWSDCWPLQGEPGAGGYTGTANTLRQLSNQDAGAAYVNSLLPAASETRNVVGWDATCTTVGTNDCIVIYDRVATYEGCSITTSTTTLTNTLAAQRYIGAGQEGLLIMVTCQTATGATAANLTSMTITDQNGNTAVAITPGFTMAWGTSDSAPTTTLPAFVNLPILNTSQRPLPWLPLAANVSGVRKIEAFTSDAINTGTVCFALIHPIATLAAQGGMNMQKEIARVGFALERIYDTACLSMMISAVPQTAQFVRASVRAVHG